MAALALFRKGGEQVPAPQPGLHVAEGNPHEVGRQRGAEDGRGVALGQHRIRTGRLEDLGEARDQAAREVGEGLARAHGIQVPVRAQLEGGHHLIEHAAVLGRGQDLDVQVPAAESLHHRSHLDHLGPGAHHADNFFHREAPSEGGTRPEPPPRDPAARG